MKIGRALITLFIAASLFSAPVHATVFFIDENGNLKTIEAVDYLAKSRHQGAIIKPQLPPVNLSVVNPYTDIVAQKARKYGVSPLLMAAVMHQENQQYDPKIINQKQACGLMQLIPSTASRFGVKDCTNPEENIDGGTAYLAWLTKRFRGEESLILAAYNAGEGAVDKYRGIPPYPETVNYVNQITEFLQKQRPQTAFVSN